MLSSFLYETSPLDPLIHAAVALLLLGVTTTATLNPARRAARIDPMAALRDPKRRLESGPRALPTLQTDRFVR